MSDLYFLGINPPGLRCRVSLCPTMGKSNLVFIRARMKAIPQSLCSFMKASSGPACWVWSLHGLGPRGCLRTHDYDKKTSECRSWSKSEARERELFRDYYQELKQLTLQDFTCLQYLYPLASPLFPRLD